MSFFKKATRKSVKLKLALTGPSGSGKTYSALKIAKGMGGRIAVLDTENGSASLYSHLFDFDVIEMNPPYLTEKYEKAIEAAVQEKYDVLVIDSLSHSWSMEGGLLEQKEQLDARGKGNSYTNWAMITKKHEAMKSAILHSPIHVIATMRSKQDYALIEKNGKQVPTKIGLAPVQRDGIEYEFTTVFDLAMNHEAEASKDRTSLFADRITKISERTGEQLMEWLQTEQNSSQETIPPPVRPLPPPVKPIAPVSPGSTQKVVDQAATYIERVISERVTAGWDKQKVANLRAEMGFISFVGMPESEVIRLGEIIKLHSPEEAMVLPGLLKVEGAK